MDYQMIQICRKMIPTPMQRTAAVDDLLRKRELSAVPGGFNVERVLTRTVVSAAMIIEKTRGIKFSRTAAGEKMKEWRARRAIKVPKPNNIIISWAQNGCSRKIPSLKSKTERVTNPARIRRMPPERRRIPGTPAAIIQAASPPGVNCPSEKVTPSWIMDTGPHSRKGNRNAELYLDKTRKKVSVYAA